ncbi:Galactosylgalactosylxylosylprotein 3-beta-glucuronosyltransferase I [Gryllus bimaculatus]|nr:Galactosylgalactosylxylosylprotein 3-beta-glucuronosyltransferase I [Gryllus bimaculatus]
MDGRQIRSLSDRGTTRLYKELETLRFNFSRLLGDCDTVPRKSDLPVIYAITPTYARPVQKAELTRLSHTFRLVPALHWIIVEDASKPSALVGKLVNKSGIPHTILTAPTPKEWKLREKDPNWKKPRGVLQRNRALQWLRENLKPKDKAVIYFADDDNVYSLELFDEVGMQRGGQKDPFLLTWLALLFRPHFCCHGPMRNRGFQESHLLQALTTRDKLEPRADRCTKVYVWHTRTESPKLNAELARRKAKKNMNDEIEV